MNKKIIALAVAGVLAAPLAAQAEVKVYGKVHVNAGTYEKVEAGVTTTDNFQFNSYDSRLGVKGEHDLGNGMAGTYLLEFGVNPDSDNIGSTAGNDGTAGFSRRNMWAGLKGNFGEFRFGRHDTPLKLVQGKFDQFGDTLGDLKHAGDEDGENRFDNVLAYLGKSGSMSYAIALVPSEGDGTTTGDGISDSISASLAYKEGPLYIGVAADTYDDTNGQAENSLTRLVSTYKFGDSQVGLLWQSGVEAADTAAAKEDWIGVSFNTRLGSDYKFKAQHIMVEDSATGADALESTLTAIGLERKFGKMASGYVMYSALEEDATNNTKDLEVNSLSVGYVIKF